MPLKFIPYTAKKTRIDENIFNPPKFKYATFSNYLKKLLNLKHNTSFVNILPQQLKATDSSDKSILIPDNSIFSLLTNCRFVAKFPVSALWRSYMFLVLNFVYLQ